MNILRKHETKTRETAPIICCGGAVIMIKKGINITMNQQTNKQKKAKPNPRQRRQKLDALQQALNL